MAGNPNIIAAQNTIGQVVDTPSATTNILQNVDDSTFQQVDSAYAATGDAVEGALGANAIPLIATPSMFNPLYMFRYAKYGSTDGKQYYPENHRDLSEIAPGTNRGPSVQSSDYKHIVENPTATEIIRWAKNGAGDNISGTILGPTPYQLNDFLWCKYYGKIPNNRLLTLRRYPIPVDDNLQQADKEMPLIPLAQAVTWWGGESGNKIGEVLGINYGFKWAKKTADVKDVQGNEVDAGALLDAVGITQAENETVRNILLATVFDNPNNPYEATGYDEKMQTWVKESYGDTGPYWNRVLGPVNVIHETTIRDRGFDFTNDIALKFTYKLRSWGNVNPKVAMLDLISNFLALTHNSAEFWGGSTRYFQKTGYILPGLPTTLFEKGDYIGGIKEVIAYIAATIKNQLEDTKKLIDDIGTGINNKDEGAITESLRNNGGAQNLAGSWVQNLMQVPLTMRSFLDGRAVGEWHLTVGNPMNPFATIGNLLVYNTTITFNEELGLDDVPTEVTFTVNLKHGRPRAKQDIESIFNLGGGKMYFSPLPPPSSAYQSQGDKDKVISETADSRGAGGSVDATQNVTTVNNPGTPENANTSSGLPPAEQMADAWRPRIRSAYGESFAQSPVLVGYFKDLKTKE